MKKFSKILVPVEGIPADDQAICLACQIARQDKATVLVIYVIEVQRMLPLDAENAPQIENGERVLQHAEQSAKQNGVRAETELLQSRAAGSALVNEALARSIDLIVMGVPFRRPLGDFLLGTTASYVMKNAPCQFWLCREAAAVDKSGKK